MEKFNITEPKNTRISTHYQIYFSDKHWGKPEIKRMYDLSFRVNLVYKPKTIWFWIKKLFNNSKSSK